MNVSAVVGGLKALEKAGYEVEGSTVAAPAPPAAPTVVEDKPTAENVMTKGAPDAPVTIIDYSDYQ